MKLKFNKSIFHNGNLIEQNEVVDLEGLDAMRYVNSKTASIYKEDDTIKIENREVELTKKVTKRGAK